METRGRPRLKEAKQQHNIRLPRLYSSLLRNDSPVLAYLRRSGEKMRGPLKHGKAKAINPSTTIQVLLEKFMQQIITNDPEWLWEFDERHPIPEKYFNTLQRWKAELEGHR